VTWVLFASAAGVIGVVLLATTTSLPELGTGFGATALTPPDIAVGDVLARCMFNLLILSLMDAIQPERISARAHQGHALAIGFGLALATIAGFGAAGAAHRPADRRIGRAELPDPGWPLMRALDGRGTRQS
jgi:Ca2+/Na+ antiporter